MVAKFLFPFVCPLEGINIEFFHFEKRFGHPCDFLFVFFLKHLVHNTRNNLPRQAVFVFEPTALLGFRIGCELSPVVIYFFFCITVYLERNTFVESKVVTTCAVPSRIPLTENREG